MTKHVGSNFLGITLFRSFQEMVESVLMVSVLLLVSWWSLNGVSVVVGVLVAALRAVCP